MKSSKKQIKKKGAFHKITPLQYANYIVDQMGFTQLFLAKKTGIQKSHISEMLNGRRRMTIKFIREFMKLAHREEYAFVLLKDYPLASLLRK